MTDEADLPPARSSRSLLGSFLALASRSELDPWSLCEVGNGIEINYKWSSRSGDQYSISGIAARDTFQYVLGQW